MIASAETERPSAGGDPRVDTVLNSRYRIEKLLGEGGMGSVYRAQHLQLRKTVAIKVLHPSMVDNPDAVARFEREAMVSAKIQHPNVVSATDSGRLEDGSLYLVLEFVPGQSLADRLERRGALPSEAAASIALQVAAALRAAHAEGVIHRDLKPQNVMLLPSPRPGDPEGGGDFLVKVLDFGIAKVVGGGVRSEPLTQAGAIFGTPEYMSPEQAKGEPVDHRADLYALGVMLHEMVCGEPPFQSQELVGVLLKHAQEPAPPLPARVPSGLARLVRDLLEKQPSKRPESAAAVEARLRALAVPPGGAVPSPDSPGAQVDRTLGEVRRRWRAVWAHPRTEVLLQRLTALGRRVPAVARPLTGLGRRLRSWAEPLARPGRRWLSRLDPRLAAAGRLPAVRFGLLGLLGLLAAVALWPQGVAEEVRMRARSGDAVALAELAEVDPGRRRREEWVALISGALAGGAWSEALASLQQALRSEPSLLKEGSFRTLARRLGEHPATAEPALAAVAGASGSSGPDLLFEVWSSTPDRTVATRAARRWLDTPAVRERASKALRLALQAREVRGCEEAKALLPAVAEHGDERAQRPLERWRRRRGCGFLRRRDCYPCLREDDAVDRALEAVRGRPAPPP